MMVQPRPLGAGPATQSEARPRDSASTPTDRDRYGPTTRRPYDSMSIADLKPVRRARPLHAVRAAHSCRLDYSFMGCLSLKLINFCGRYRIVPGRKTSFPDGF